jgi:outer membrane receptor for ferrienterochelin and colicin
MKLKTAVLFVIIILCSTQLMLAKNVQGIVYDSSDKKTPLAGVNIYWAGTTQGTTSKANGFFKIVQPKNHSLLVFSYVGYQTDTLKLQNEKELTVFLIPGTDLNEIAIKERVKATNISKINPLLVQTITNKELTKFACCNLSESFETNASVDVSFADAVSGIKQIKLLGLSGRYSQMMMENIPILRGAESAFGLEYVPGTWLQSIQVSKGSAAVKNGYESITGQINIQYKEPDGLEKMSFYAYANQDGKLESNATYSLPINDKWSTSLLLHMGSNARKFDMNNDGFLDKPLSSHINVMNRWNYKNQNTTFKFGLSMVDEIRKGGQNNYNFNQSPNEQNTYGILIDVQRWNAFAKIGHIFNRPATNLGWINSINRFYRHSFYGFNNYDALQVNYYSNLIFQSYIGNIKHTFNTGLSLSTDKNKEQLNSIDLGYNEWVTGVFFEYNYIPSESFSFLSGVRYDYSSLYGAYLTPRIHAKYHFPAYTSIRASVGKGYRTAASLNENTQLLASSMQFVFNETKLQEEAWNYGISLVNEIPLGSRDLSLTLEYFRTDFIKQLVVDLEQNPGFVNFYTLDGKSFSNSAQIELYYELFKRFELTTAFRWNDVKSTYNETLKSVPMIGKYKGLISAQYRTNMDKWQFDATLQFHGQSRLVSTQNNSAENVRSNYSENYVSLIAQITKNYRNWSFYVGGENLSNYIQKNAIIDPSNPFGDEYDASQIWGPIYGRMFYVGIKYSMNKR